MEFINQSIVQVSAIQNVLQMAEKLIMRYNDQKTNGKVCAWKIKTIKTINRF